jgi:hypothetical protein
MRARYSGWLVAVGVGCLLVAAGAQAQLTSTDRPGSILMFPKVVRDGTRDTIIQITNTGNSVNTVHCQYLDGSPGRTGAPQCVQTDFSLALTRQQPTQWRVSTGRQVNLNDALGAPGAGYDPGLIPPVPLGFTGALLCFEVMPDGSLAPFAQNRLKGEATIVRNSNNDVSKYNAVAIQGVAPNVDDNLALDNVEYGRCPSTLRANLIPDGALDPVIESYGAGNGASSVVTNVTFVPCNLDFRNGVSNSATTISVFVWDEFEVRTSTSFNLNCWTSFNIGVLSQLRSALQAGSIQTQFVNAQFSSTVPFVGVAESFHADSFGVTAAAAVNMHETAETTNATIRLP